LSAALALKIAQGNTSKQDTPLLQLTLYSVSNPFSNSLRSSQIGRNVNGREFNGREVKMYHVSDQTDKELWQQMTTVRLDEEPEQYLSPIIPTLIAIRFARRRTCTLSITRRYSSRAQYRRTGSSTKGSPKIYKPSSQRQNKINHSFHNTTHVTHSSPPP